jgi:acyl-CoA synthetase (AMP-forming)/AMP-acid ligase II
MVSQSFAWPNGRKKLLNHIVDDIARAHPNAPYAEIPVSSTSFDQGFRKVSYRAFANAINGMAWWLEKTLGKGQSFETLAYIGPNDLRHVILLLAAVKAGFKVSC